MANGRCRMHGGPSTGPRTAEGLARLRAARTRTGLHTAEMVGLRRLLSALRRAARRALEQSRSAEGRVDCPTSRPQPQARRNPGAGQYPPQGATDLTLSLRHNS